MALNKKDVVTLALDACGGSTSVVDTEDAAVAAHKIAAELFSWRKYPEQIDLDGVRVALRHESETGEPRVSGSVRHGWHLTVAGVTWINSSVERDPSVTTSRRPDRRRAETRHSGAELARLRSSDAFRLWAEGSPVPARAAAAVFRIDHYTSERDRTLKTQRISDLVSSDEELTTFIAAMAPLAREVSRPENRAAIYPDAPGDSDQLNPSNEEHS